MSAEEMLKENYSTKPDIDNPYKLYWSEDVIQAMKEYAELKCQELLEIVAEKVNIRHTFTSTIDGKTTHSYDKIFSTKNSMFTIDKDSLDNVVDLDSFCS